jgi:hypothetical protein
MQNDHRAGSEHEQLAQPSRGSIVKMNKTPGLMLIAVALCILGQLICTAIWVMHHDAPIYQWGFGWTWLWLVGMAMTVLGISMVIIRCVNAVLRWYDRLPD